MAACPQLGFDVTENSAIRSADPENPTLEPNMKCIGSPVAEIWPFAYLAVCNDLTTMNYKCLIFGGDLNIDFSQTHGMSDCLNEFFLQNSI